MYKQLFALIALGFGVAAFVVFIVFTAFCYLSEEKERDGIPKLVATVDGCNIYEVIANYRYLYVSKCADGSTMNVTTP